MSEESHPNERHMTPRTLFYLALGSVGVVYGDIGTSPLYAFREAVGNCRSLAGDFAGAAKENRQAKPRFGRHCSHGGINGCGEAFGAFQPGHLC